MELIEVAKILQAEVSFNESFVALLNTPQLKSN
jgi:hypothetical protein